MQVRPTAYYQNQARRNSRAGIAQMHKATHHKTAAHASHGHGTGSKAARAVPANLRETRVTFTNTSREKLVGTLLMDAQGKWENVVILCHGYASSKVRC